MNIMWNKNQIDSRKSRVLHIYIRYEHLEEKFTLFMKIFSVNEMSSLRIVLSRKCPSVKCPVYEISFLGNVPSMKCLSIVLKWVGGGGPLWNFVTFVLFHWTSKLKFLGFVRKIYELRMTNIFSLFLWIFILFLSICLHAIMSRNL